MPSFLSSLLVLVSSFILGGKPVDVPPFISDEVSQRGSQVSELVRHLPSLTPSPTPSDESESNVNVQTGDNNENKPDVTKAPAYNNKSEKEMPTDIPQNAVENSQALEAGRGSGVSVNSDSFENTTPRQFYLSDHQPPDLILSSDEEDSEPGFAPAQEPEGYRENNGEKTNPSENNHRPLEIPGPNGIFTVSE